MMNILVTGSTGYVGSHLYKELKKRYPDAQIMGCDPKDGIDYAELHDFDFDWVFHLGAISILGDSFDLADNMIETNALKLIDFFQNNKIEKFIFSSSGAVYGERETPAKEEDAHWKSCLNPYSQSKYIAEGIIRRMHSNSFIARFGNVFGGYVPPRAETLSLTHFKNDNPITVFGGDQVRDFIHVDIICDALIKAAEFNLTGVYNLAHGFSTRLGDLAEQFGQKRGVPIIYKPVRSVDVKNTILNVDKAKKANLIPKKTPINDYYS
jgi:UDP-glucose 4-epimerase